MLETTEKLTLQNHRSLSSYAYEIASDWRTKGKGISPYAKPYLEAMYSLDRITDRYICDSAVSVVLYFLSNATSWKGETAKRVKKELNAICKLSTF